MSEQQNNITVVDENGNEQLCEILHTFDSEEFGKSYVLYSLVGAENGEDGELTPIETEAEWDLIEEVLNQIEDELGEEE